MEECRHCHGPLTGNVHAMRGSLYCSKECAIEDTTNDIIMVAKEAAEELYNTDAEIIALEDIT